MSDETTRPTRGFFGLGKFVPAAIRYIKGDTGARGPQGEKGEKGATGATGPQGPKGDTGAQGPKGADGKDGKDGADGAAATVTVGSTTTLPAGSNASVTNSGTTSAAVLDFSIPQGAQGAQGPKGDPQTPSDATPQMDGTGAAGSSTTYARGDHVHPSDTAKLDVAGGTMTGPLEAPLVKVSSGGAVVVGTSDGTVSLAATAAGAPVVSSAADSGGGGGSYNQRFRFPANPSLPNDTVRDVSTMENLAPAFSASSTYAVGDYCTHEGLLYKCSTAVSTAGAWDASDWTAVAVTGEMGQSTPLPFDAEVEYVTFPAGAYVDPEIVDIGMPNAYDIDASIRIQTFDFFRFGNYRDNNLGHSFMIFPSSGVIKLSKYWTDGNGVSPPSGFFPIKTTCMSYTVGTTTLSFSSGITTGQIKNAGFLICAVDDRYQGTITPSQVDIDIAYFRFIGNTVLRDLVPVRVGTTGYLYDRVSGRLFGSAVPSIPLTCGPDKAVPTITTPDKLVEIDERNNYLAIASTTTLDPATAVYRATATLSGTTATMPTVTITGIPTAAAYFAFELEIAVDATATAIDQTAWSGWTWMDGGALPTSDYAGKTLFIACRLDCTARTIVANCYDVR